jgi:hypothetical protein
MPKNAGRLRFTPEFIANIIRLEDAYPGFQRLEGHWDFDSNTFQLKFRHPDLPIVEEGEVIPFIDIAYEIDRVTGAPRARRA